MENKTRYQELREEIIKCVETDFKAPNNLVIPFERSVLVKKHKNQTIELESGILLADVGAANVRKPNIGVVYAVGPQVPNYIIPGLRVYFNQNNDLEFLLGGGYYHMMDYMDLFAAIPDNAFVSMNVKDDKELAREKGIASQDSYLIRKETNNQNELDKIEELKKKVGKGYKA